MATRLIFLASWAQMQTNHRSFVVLAASVVQPRRLTRTGEMNLRRIRPQMAQLPFFSSPVILLSFEVVLRKPPKG
jgi:hypothetical protein